MIGKVDHIGCIVESIEKAVEDYLILYPAAKVAQTVVIGSQKVKECFLELPGLRIGFIEPLDQDSSLFKMLKKTPGFYHLALFTDDLSAEIARLESNGYRKINQFKSIAFDNSECAFLFNREMHLIELIQS